MSLSTAGVQGDGHSYDVAISASGRFVVMGSYAANLVAGDTNAVEDVFVRDRDTDRDGKFDEPGAVRTRRVSVSTAGVQADGETYPVGVSASGRFVVFASDATNLVPGDTNASTDIFVRDRDTDRDGIFDEAGTVRTTRLSLTSDGTQADAESDAGTEGAISPTGRFVVFHSNATNLVPNDTNGKRDVFARDRDIDRDGKFDEVGAVRTTRLSLTSAGGEANEGSFAPTISATGRFVSFGSYANNLAAGDTNGANDVFVRDRDADRDGRFDEAGAAKTRRISVSTAGVGADSESSPNGISANGRFVVFNSAAGNLVPNDTNGQRDIFVRDRDSDRDGRFDEPAAVKTRRLTLSSTGVQGDGSAFVAAVSGNGRFVVFISTAENLVTGDTNAVRDAFLRDRDTDRDGRFDEPGAVRTRRVSLTSAGAQANDHSYNIAISTNGRLAVFTSVATNLVSADTNGFRDVFLRGPL